MTVQPAGPSCPRQEGTSAAFPALGPARVSDETSLRQPEAPAIGQRDVLEPSPAARALVARADGDGALSAERLLAIRQRILDGAYDVPLVLDAVAAGLRKSGEFR